MADEWIETKLGDVLTLQRGFDLPKYRRVEGAYPVIASTGIVGTHNEAMVKGPGVVIGRSGSIGGGQYIESDFWPLNTTLWVKDFKENHRRFCYYLLRSLDFSSFNVGSGVPTLNRNHIHPLRLKVPTDKDEQSAIAHILGTLDDKIELNRRMNETLEAMARALFKSWFVDFDPVRAKAEGQPTGLPKEMEELFPDSFAESELGKIPRGWRIGMLSELCTTQYGYTASATDEPVGPKFLRVTDINKQNWIEWSSVPHCEIDNDIKGNYLLKVGDIVVARMADPGKSAIIDDDIEAVFASYLVRLKTLSMAHSYYVYGFLKSPLYAEYSEGAKSGSVQANMNAKVIVGASLAVPPEPLIQQYLTVTLLLRKRIAANVNQSRTFTAIRDTFLPKLMSGDIRTPTNIAGETDLEET